ncbi:hypothetical protein RXV86_18735 [Alisedimentitalea sp. MJ-SS2]|uniref:hypothetical protein n=1 Tax=Aliisedimentitalea sp. MJ-SS2 TaxID=3049795 RepID=UPI0029153FC6|nr:hypothetical protein [Alisedimentitalea sp. MJ-SS2]MDU8929429.1 hypothetical protein [Alisedimentitalea sp. MJ-SS2]
MYSAWPSKVDARCFNAAQRALKRRGALLRLPLPDLARLELILQPHDWIVVDPSLSDIPVVAWMGLERASTRGIHEAVDCELCYYHGAAGKVAAKVPELLIAALREPVDPVLGQTQTVIQFPRN